MTLISSKKKQVFTIKVRDHFFPTMGSVPVRRLSRECRSLPAIRESESGQFTAFLILQANCGSGPHQSDTLDPDPHQFADGKLKCIKYEAI
jgi:hypothetical protein